MKKKKDSIILESKLYDFVRSVGGRCFNKMTDHFKRVQK